MGCDYILFSDGKLNLILRDLLHTKAALIVLLNVGNHLSVSVKIGYREILDFPIDLNQRSVQEKGVDPNWTAQRLQVAVQKSLKTISGMNK